MLDAAESGELDRRHHELSEQSAELLREIEASRHIDPAVLHLRMTV